MDYTSAASRFDLDKHIKSLSGLDWLDMASANQKAILSAESVSIPSKSMYRRDIEGRQREYVQNLKGLAYILHSGGKPAGMRYEILASFKPLIEELVSKEQLKPGILEIFK
jgi:hypothetical protein